MLWVQCLRSGLGGTGEPFDVSLVFWSLKLQVARRGSVKRPRWDDQTLRLHRRIGKRRIDKAFEIFPCAPCAFDCHIVPHSNTCEVFQRVSLSLHEAKARTEESDSDEDSEEESIPKAICIHIYIYLHIKKNIYYLFIYLFVYLFIYLFVYLFF